MAAYLGTLTIEGFRSFVEKSVVEFPSTGFMLLQGHNKDTGGSSGSGKSSVLLAIAYALGYCPYPATELTSWGAKSPSVELTLPIKEGHVRVRRNPNLSVWVNDEQVKGGAKAAEERLRTILRAEPEIVGLLTYRGQRSPGLFLSQTDSEKKELLTRLLGLDKFEQAIETTGQKVKDLETKLERAKAALDTNQKVLEQHRQHESPEALQKLLDELEHNLRRETAKYEGFVAKIKDLQKDREKRAQVIWDSFHPQISEAKEALKLIPAPQVQIDDVEEVRLAGVQAECQRRIDALKKADNDKAKQLKTERDRLQKELLECREEMALLPQRLKEQKRLQDELAASIENCPTCERPWVQGGSHQEKLRKQLSLIELDIGESSMCEKLEKELRFQIQELPEFEPNPVIAKLETAKAAAYTERLTEQSRRTAEVALVRAEYNQRLSAAKALIQELESTQRAETAEAKSKPVPEIPNLEVLAKQAGGEVTTLISNQAELQVRLRHAQQSAQQYLHWKQVVERLEATYDATNAELAAEKDFLGMIGREGFLGSIFDEVLSEISDETNIVLGNVANTRHCTIRFQSETTTQKGTVKKTIVPVVNVGGEDVPLASGLSGGMLSTVELAVDLAVGAVISRRSGATPGWLILDESFEGLDTVSKETCMEMLSRYAQERLVLVIDHSSECKSLFSKVITVEYENGKSKIV